MTGLHPSDLILVSILLPLAAAFLIPVFHRSPNLREGVTIIAAVALWITVLDLVLPRILAGETITKKELAFIGHGGLCMDCPECSYPHCPFGKGM